MALSSLNIPWSSSTVSVSVIDTTMALSGMPPNSFFGPDVPGYDNFNGISYAFLVSHPDSNVVFDLGLSKNWREDLPPDIVANTEALLEQGATLSVERDVSEVLTDAGVSLDSINSVIWSHSHFDHIGRPSLFPLSTELVVGPDTFDFFGVGYPLNESSPFLARDFEGREVREIEFDDIIERIGGFQAHDFFGDGSFYLLHAPGHEVGHLNGLARVTSDPDTFIFMGADSFHHTSQLRPSKHVPLPDFINMAEPPESFPNPIPGEIFHPIHPSSDIENLPPYAENLTSPVTSSFTTVLDGSPFSRDPNIARDVISKIQAFDGDDRVLIVAAHDTSIYDLLDYFPDTLNDWQAKGLKEQGRWQFLADFEDGLELKPCLGRRHPHQIV